VRSIRVVWIGRRRARLASTAMAQQGTGSKDATANTERANAAVRQAMAMNDKQDFEDATRGLMAQLQDPIVKAADGRMVWNTQRYEFVKGDPPPTVNPSLWREQKLNTAAGLFKVVDGIYQIRGYDMANMTLVEGASGWIVTLCSSLNGHCLDLLESLRTAARCCRFVC
jgi:alkyl sulfatase BDS1-like metallo-beta-lactamase superfamily hydrolase